MKALRNLMPNEDENRSKKKRKKKERQKIKENTASFGL